MELYDPPGIATSQFFGYNGDYHSSDTIYPGRAYWVKTDQSGKLMLSSSQAAPLNRIRITPSQDHPPAPPGGGNGTAMVTTSKPVQTALGQNYPNSFNPVTVICYSLPVDSWVSLRVYDLLGQEIATLVDGFEYSGVKSVAWDAGRTPSRLYFCKLRAGNLVDVNKAVPLR